MGLFSLKPARSQAKESARIVADLDALIAEPVAFRFRGQTHLIKPITTKEFYKYVDASQRVFHVMRDVNATKDEVVEAALAVISSVCDTIGRKDVDEMTQAQVGALITLVVETVTGKSSSDTQKKNLVNH